MAYSNDRGRTWTKYAGNPVLPAITHHNRDPKVIWHDPTKTWVMVITLSCQEHWLRGNDGDYRFAFFSSPDLKHWQEMSRFDMPRGLDCCDLFELPVDGKADNRRWVLWAGDGTHAIGTFDGRVLFRRTASACHCSPGRRTAPMAMPRRPSAKSPRRTDAASKSPGCVPWNTAAIPACLSISKPSSPSS